jgi:hypothetical protein
MKSRLNIHGFIIDLISDAQQLHEWICFDLSWFVVDMHESQAPHETINVHQAPPPENLIPILTESSRGPNYVAFDLGETRYVKYSDSTWVVWEQDRHKAQCYNEFIERLYEHCYLFIMSRAGEYLDLKQMHRVHGLAFARDEQACLVLIPEGGGKSTLAHALLADSAIKLLSDDTPLICSKGKIHAFPARLGFSSELAKEVPQEFTRVFKRWCRPEKTLVHIDAYKGQIQEQPLAVTKIYLAAWINGDEPQIQSISKIKGWWALARDCIVGLGLPQVVEYFLRGGPEDFLLKCRIVFYRIWAVCNVLIHAKCYRILLSTDSVKNKQILLDHMPGEHHGQ